MQIMVGNSSIIIRIGNIVDLDQPISITKEDSLLDIEIELNSLQELFFEPIEFGQGHSSHLGIITVGVVDIFGVLDGDDCCDQQQSGTLYNYNQVPMDVMVVGLLVHVVLLQPVYINDRQYKHFLAAFVKSVQSFQIVQDRYRRNIVGCENTSG